MSKKLVKNISSNLINQVITAGLGIVFIPIYVNLLGVSNFGIISLFTVILAWSGLIEFGFPYVVSRYASLFKAKKKSAADFVALFKTIERAFLILTIVLMIGISLVLYFPPIHRLIIDSNITEYTLLAVVAISLMRVMESIYRHLMVGLEEFNQLNTLQILMQVVRYGGTFLCLYYVESTIHIFFMWQFLASAISLISFSILAKIKIPKVFDRTPIRFNLIKSNISFAGHMAIVSISSMISIHVDKIILISVGSTYQLGLFMIAATLSNSIYMLMAPVQSALTPRLLNLYEKDDITSFNSLLLKVTTISSAIIFSISSAIFFNSYDILHIWIGDIDIANKLDLVLAVLFLSSSVGTISSLLDTALVAAGVPRISSISNMASLVLLTIMLYITIPLYGLHGIAYSWLIIQLMFFLIIPPLVFNVLRVKIYWRWFFTVIKYFVITFSIGFFINWILVLNAHKILLIFIHITIPIFISFALMKTEGINVLNFLSPKKGILKDELY